MTKIRDFTVCNQQRMTKRYTKDWFNVNIKLSQVKYNR